MNTSTLLVLGVLGLLVYMYIKKDTHPAVNPNTSLTQNSSGNQQVSGKDVYNGVMTTINRIFDSVDTAIQTSPNSV